MRKEYLVFGAPCIESSDIQAITDTLQSGWIGTGPKVAQFQDDFKSYRQANHAVALNSCTAALHLSLVASGIGPGDEVITTPLTFVASINAILHAGATPVLADIDPNTLNIDPKEIAKKIGPNTKAILPVHYAGRPCEMDEILSLAKEHDLIIVEDCAHAIEATYKGQPVGTFGDFGCFSFYVTKNMVTGEGGMVLTQSEENATRIKTLGLHGMSKDAWKRFSDDGYKHYFVNELGFKYNMMDIQAAMGIEQLKRIDTYYQRRVEIWERYMDAFSDLPIGLPPLPADDTIHALHLYTLRINESTCGISRDQMLTELDKRKIGTGVHYMSVPEHPFYQRTLAWSPDDYPNARDYGRETLSLPFSAKLTDEDVEDVIGAVKGILKDVRQESLITN